MIKSLTNNEALFISYNIEKWGKSFHSDTFPLPNKLNSYLRILRAPDFGMHTPIARKHPHAEEANQDHLYVQTSGLVTHVCSLHSSKRENNVLWPILPTSIQLFSNLGFCYAKWKYVHLWWVISKTFEHAIPKYWKYIITNQH